MKLSFSISVGQVDGLEMKRVRQAIVEQAEAQGIGASTTQNTSRVHVELDGPEGFVNAYEAAVKCWANNR